MFLPSAGYAGCKEWYVCESISFRASWLHFKCSFLYSFSQYVLENQNAFTSLYCNPHVVVVVWDQIHRRSYLYTVPFCTITVINSTYSPICPVIFPRALCISGSTLVKSLRSHKKLWMELPSTFVYLFSLSLIAAALLLCING